MNSYYLNYLHRSSRQFLFQDSNYYNSYLIWILFGFSALLYVIMEFLVVIYGSIMGFFYYMATYVYSGYLFTGWDFIYHNFLIIRSL